jgi:hypothetical protein
LAQVEAKLLAGQRYESSSFGELAPSCDCSTTLHTIHE